MAERRTIAKKISVSEQVNSLSTDFARLLFTWMIPHADDYGVLSGSAWSIRSLVIPMLERTNVEVEAALAELEAHELVWRYMGRDKKPYLQFRTWEEHQSGLHKRTAPHQPLYFDPRTHLFTVDRDQPENPGTTNDDDADTSGFPELPAARVRGNETKGNDGKRREDTPTVVVSADDAPTPNTDTVSPPVDASAPLARSMTSSTRSPTQVTQATNANLPARLASDTTERAYWERVMKDLPSAQRVPALVTLAHEKIGVDATPGGAGYARLGQLAKKHTASLVAVWIIQASGQHIAGDPLDYLVKVASGQIGRSAHNQRGGSSSAAPARPEPPTMIPASQANQWWVQSPEDTAPAAPGARTTSTPDAADAACTTDALRSPPATASSVGKSVAPGRPPLHVIAA